MGDFGIMALNMETSAFWITRYMMANCSYFVECDGEHEFDEPLMDMLFEETKVLNLFFQRENKKKNAIKEIAMFTIRAAEGAFLRGDNRLGRRYVTDGTNDAAEIALGAKTYEILKSSHAVVCKMLKHEKDYDKEEIVLLIQSSAYSCRRSLAKIGRYKGPLLP
jgi:hypothetical protein